MKRFSLLPCFALGLALLCSACGGGGGGGGDEDSSSDSPASSTAQGPAILSNAVLESSTNDWPSGSTDNQLVIVGLEFGTGTVDRDGVETGKVVDFISLAMSSSTGLADMKFNLPSSYTYVASSGQLSLHGVDVFDSGNQLDLVFSLTSASDTTMNITLTGNPYATDSSGIRYRISLLKDSMTIHLEDHIDEDDGDSGSSGNGGVAPIMEK
ncbi:MAG: hypothetical protein R3Y56_02960 [Akkermansia sp.]